LDYWTWPRTPALSVRAPWTQRAAVPWLMFMEQHFEHATRVLHVLAPIGEKGKIVGITRSLPHALQPEPKPLLHRQTGRVRTNRRKGRYTTRHLAGDMALVAIAHADHLLVTHPQIEIGTLLVTTITAVMDRKAYHARLSEPLHLRFSGFSTSAYTRVSTVHTYARDRDGANGGSYGKDPCGLAP